MNRFRVLLLAILLGACAAAPIRWSIGSGGNGHFYELVAPPQGISWTDARDAAAASTYLGHQGHLVTVNSQQEWDFITTRFPRDWTWIGLTDAGQEGNFQWVTGEPLTFTRWIPGEPNNAGGFENFVFMQRSSALGGAFAWNDFPNYTNVFTASLPIGYVIEYVPEPSTITLAALAVLSLAVCGRQRFR